MEFRVDRERDRRSVVHPPAPALEQVRPCAGRFVLLRGARLIHGIPRRGCCRAEGAGADSDEPDWFRVELKAGKTCRLDLQGEHTGRGNSFRSATDHSSRMDRKK